MIGNRCGGKPSLKRIADALGMDPTMFYSACGEPQVVRDTLALLSAFERIKDVDDRRRCLEFITAVAERQQLAEAR